MQPLTDGLAEETFYDEPTSYQEDSMNDIWRALAKVRGWAFVSRHWSGEHGMGGIEKGIRGGP